MDGDPYNAIDPFLMPWAQRHGLRVGKLDRDYPVRSIWVYDRAGNSRAQMWLGLPNAHGEITVRAAELDLSNPSKWGRREQRVATLENLEDALEQLRVLAFEWSGPGAFT